MNNLKLPRRYQAQWQLIFGGNDTIQGSLDTLEEKLDKIEEDRPSQDKSQWPSAYVTVFEGALLSSLVCCVKQYISNHGNSWTEMVATVLNNESNLLNSQEIDLLQNFSKLSCKIRHINSHRP